MKDKGPVSVSTVQINGAVHYRVMVGPWSSKAEAQQAMGQMGGTKAFVVARSN